MSDVNEKYLTGQSLLELVEDQSAWSQETFGPDFERGPVGPLRHLEKEAKEAYEEKDEKRRRKEIADAFLLVLDASRRSGMTLRELIAIAKDKMAENRRREWPMRALFVIGEPIPVEVDGKKLYTMSAARGNITVSATENTPEACRRAVYAGIRECNDEAVEHIREDRPENHFG